MKRLAYLDGVRGLAILGLLLLHCLWQLPALQVIGGPWVATGQLGVHTFFVLSGYLITTLLLREEEKRVALPCCLL